MSETENNGSDINLQEAPKYSLFCCTFVFSGSEAKGTWLIPKRCSLSPRGRSFNVCREKVKDRFKKIKSDEQPAIDGV